MSLVFLYLMHLLGDFALQTRWMGKNKYKNWLALAVHVGVYTAALLGGFLAYGLAYDLSSQAALFFAGINGACHFVTDAVTSRLSHYCWRRGHEHKFWFVIGLDQFIHMTTFVLTARWLTIPLW